MASITLLTLRTAARERADAVNSTFVSDTELTRYINASAQELYDLLVESNKDYATTLLSFSVSSPSTSYALPSDFYKLRGLDVSLNGSWVQVYPYDQMERGRYQDLALNRVFANVYYHLFNNTLEFLPQAYAPGSYQLRYVPFMTVMSGDSDTFNGYNGFEEYIIVDAAIKMKDKEETDTKVLEKQKADLRLRIQAMANVRDYADFDRVSDVRSRATIFTAV